MTRRAESTCLMDRRARGCRWSSSVASRAPHWEDVASATGWVCDCLKYPVQSSGPHSLSACSAHLAVTTSRADVQTHASLPRSRTEPCAHACSKTSASSDSGMAGMVVVVGAMPRLALVDVFRGHAASTAASQRLVLQRLRAPAQWAERGGCVQRHGAWLYGVCVDIGVLAGDHLTKIATGRRLTTVQLCRQARG